MIFRTIFIAVALALLSGCGAGGAKFSGLEKPDSGLAQVYIFRPSTFVQSGNFPDLALDSKEIGQLKNGGYLKFSAQPGQHTLSVTGNIMQWIHPDTNIPLTLEAGKNHFYKLTVSVSGSRSGNSTYVGLGQHHSFGFYQITDEKEALADLAELNESN